MIFYFSGTGNSLYIAKNIQKKSRATLISIVKELRENRTYYEYVLEEGEDIGFVFPVYAWAPPKMVLDFIDKVEFSNYKDNYIYSVVACGENIGDTMKLVDKKLKDKNLKLHSGFSAITPNNYIVLGDVDSKDIEEKKLKSLEEFLINVNKIISKKERGVFLTEKGSIPWVLTNVVSLIFNKSCNSTKKFYADDKCIGCGICEKICPSSCISVKEKPSWKGDCTHCLSCINLCPTKAIQYGKNTKNKGRYKNPNILLAEMDLSKQDLT